MSTIIFYLWLLIGTIVPSEKHEGVQMYNIIEDDGVIENAYKGEIINYIETGEFEYNDFLEL
jgi:hypothetical protein